MMYQIEPRVVLSYYSKIGDAFEAINLINRIFNTNYSDNKKAEFVFLTFRLCKY